MIFASEFENLRSNSYRHFNGKFGLWLIDNFEINFCWQNIQIVFGWTFDGLLLATKRRDHSFNEIIGVLQIVLGWYDGEWLEKELNLVVSEAMWMKVAIGNIVRIEVTSGKKSKRNSNVLWGTTVWRTVSYWISRRRPRYLMDNESHKSSRDCLK